MTEHQFKKTKKHKKSHLFLLITAIIVVVGLLAFVIAEGVANGWDSVAAWFGSADAVILYVGLGVYGLLVAWFIINERINKL